METVAAALLLAGCVDTTGSALVTFHAAAAGPADATGALETVTSAGYHVSFTTATIHIGGVYLRVNARTSGAGVQPCILSGPNYSGQVLEGLDVNLLSPDPQPFPGLGEGTADLSPIGEVWLVGGGAVDAITDLTVIARLAGTATQGATSIPFSAAFTISTGNRGIMSGDPSQPGANPICKQRIVTPIDAGFHLADGGTLVVRADPREWVSTTEFSDVPADPSVPGGVAFRDDNTDDQSKFLFSALRGGSTYSLTFVPAPSPQEEACVRPSSLSCASP